MLFSIFLFTLGLALPGVHSVPALSKSFSEVDLDSKISNVARTLPPRDQYPPQPPGGGPGKRGLLYSSSSQEAWSGYYVGSSFVTYGTNGDVIRGDELDSHFSFVPTIIVDASLKNAQWKDIVPILIEGGTKALLA